jgi:hypothetical protein
MTTSGITTYQLNRDQIVTASLRKLGVIAVGQTPDAEAIANAAQALNAAIAELRGMGMPLWSRFEYTFTPTTNVYTIGNGYTLNTPYPLRVLQAFRTSGNIKIPMDIESLEDFNKLPVNTGAAPIKLSYSPSINFGTLKFWPTPPSTNIEAVTIVYQKPFEYFNTQYDTMAFPEEWYNALIYKLAVLLAPEWGIPLPDRRELKQELETYLSNALANGQEDGSFFFSPDRN